MDYISWSQEYLEQAQRILSVIERKKSQLSLAGAEQRKMINSDIIKLRNIYYECMYISKHLYNRAKVIDDAA